MNERIEELAKECYVKTGSEHTDHFAYWKFAELLKQAIYDEVKEDLTPDELINIEPDSLNREYLKGSNGGTTDALYRIKMFGVEE